MASRSCMNQNSRSVLVQGLNPASVLGMLSMSQRWISGPYASFRGVTQCTHQLNILAVSGSMCCFISVVAILIDKKLPGQDWQMQTPLLEAMNRMIQSCRPRQAHTATHSLDLESSRTPAVLGSNICRRQDWHFLYVFHARTYQVLILWSISSMLRL